MQKSEVKEINIHPSLKAIGKIFSGDYSKSQEYITELKSILNEKAIPFIENKVMGVYYDNPSEKKPEELKSFQGIFLMRKLKAPDESFIEISLAGKYIYTKVSGDPLKSIYEGYDAIFEYIGKNNIILQSNAGYQISTYENEIINTELYMKMI